jgi:hypothetical protein
MSAPITESHIALAARITRENGYDPESKWNRPHVLRDAQYIADSEARACDQLRAEVERLRRATTNGQLNWMQESDRQYARAERAEKIILAREATIVDLHEKLESETARANEFDAVLGEIKQALDEMGAPIAAAIGCRLLVSSERVKRLNKFTHPLAEREEGK